MGTIGFIGCGNMAKAIMRGVLAAEIAVASDIVAADVDAASLAAAAAKLGIRPAGGNIDVAQQSDIVFLAVKPYAIDGVIREIAPHIAEGTIVASIAAGQSLAAMESAFGKPVKLVRLMPNTPAQVGEGMTAACPNSQVGGEDMERLGALLKSFGKCEVIPETMMDAEVAIAGSGPAYVFMFIEAMADAAVAEGMPRDKAYLFAAQTVLGSAKMALESGMHPGALKDMVCSPAGTTIEAVAVLEKEGFRNAVIQAVRACANKSRELGAM